MASSTQERWSQLRLLVDRGCTGSCYVSVVLRSVDGGDRRDRRITTVRMDSPQGSLTSTDWWHALAAAVEALSESGTFV